MRVRDSGRQSQRSRDRDTEQERERERERDCRPTTWTNKHGLGSTDKAGLILALPFHFLIKRLIHPVTSITIRTCDLLSSHTEMERLKMKKVGGGKAERERERGERLFESANQYAYVISAQASPCACACDQLCLCLWVFTKLLYMSESRVY